MRYNINYADLYNFLVQKHGEDKALKITRTIETVLLFRDDIERIHMQPQARFEQAMTRLEGIAKLAA